MLKLINVFVFLLQVHCTFFFPKVPDYPHFQSFGFYCRLQYFSLILMRKENKLLARRVVANLGNVSEPVVASLRCCPVFSANLSMKGPSNRIGDQIRS